MPLGYKTVAVQGHLCPGQALVLWILGLARFLGSAYSGRESPHRLVIRNLIGNAFVKELFLRISFKGLSASASLTIRGLNYKYVSFLPQNYGDTCFRFDSTVSSRPQVLLHPSTLPFLGCQFSCKMACYLHASISLHTYVQRQEMKEEE